MQISGSILAVKNEFMDYARVLKKSGVDYLHIDLFGKDDGEFKFSDILRFDESYLPLDVHMIYERVTDRLIDTVNKSTARILSLQYESLDNPPDAIRKASLFKGSLGLAVTPSTSMKDIEPYLGSLQHLLVMCSEPGVSGAKFQSGSYQMLDTLHERHPSLSLYADGGIEGGIAKQMSSHKVKMVVSGSYLAKNVADMDQKIYELKFGGGSDIPISHLLIKPISLPVVGMKADFLEIIEAINGGKLGVCFVVDNGKLQGIICDGDIRRAYLKFEREIFAETAGQIMNTNYFSADMALTLKDLYLKVLEEEKPISVIPVTSNGEFIGAVSLR
ncbi:MAG: CBS domain-containing protein [Clostridiales bacterium]|jgi:pentose-5-phosphate-3-epimerase|nr:CBS domain-containing protein [Clostridiales bacterium]